MTEAHVDVLIPSKAVSATGQDIEVPTTTLLRKLNLLGKPEELDAATGFVSAFAGPPQSVALIEAGATAASKWWAAGLGATVIATWGAVVSWWGGQDSSVKVAVMAGAAFITGSVVLTMGYLLASDVKGRADAAVATINARASVADAMIRASQAVYEPPRASSGSQLLPVPFGLKAKYLSVEGKDEDGWSVVAIERDVDGARKYVIVKGSKEATVPIGELEFAENAAPGGASAGHALQQLLASMMGEA